MQKILLSLGIVGVAGALAIGATGAFFTDTQTSTGNTFTAGDLTLGIDSTSHYDGLVCTAQNVWAQDPAIGPNPTSRPDLIGQPCDGTWALGAFGPTSKFFNISDIKPGDGGEDTISLHPTNDAWACATIKTTSNKDNTCTTPEIAAETANGTVCGAGDANSNGDLAQNTYVFAWLDNAVSTSTPQAGTPGDNIWQSEEKVLFQPTKLSAIAGSGITVPLADSGTATGPIGAGSTSYVGVAWCTGTIDVSVPGAIKCNGATLGNEAQTDSATADIILNAVQSRNNPNFLCSQEAAGPTIGALVVTPPATSCTVTADPAAVEDSTHSHTINGAIGLAAVTTGSTVCVVPGTYAEDVVVNKSITLDGTGGASVTTINGQATGQGTAMRLAANNVTLEGFTVNGAGIAALWSNTGVSGASVHDNHFTSASGGNTALTTQGQQSNDTFTNNEFTGKGSAQVAYVNGVVSLGAGQDSDNVDFVHNTFDGTIIAGREALGSESTNANYTQNVFKSTLTSTYAIAETWKSDAVYSQNNFDGVGGIKVRNSAGAGTVNAQNNWWGAAVPVGNTSGSVDDSAKAASAFPEN